MKYEEMKKVVREFLNENYFPNFSLTKQEYQEIISGNDIEIIDEINERMNFIILGSLTKKIKKINKNIILVYSTTIEHLNNNDKGQQYVGLLIKEENIFVEVFINLTTIKKVLNNQKEKNAVLINLKASENSFKKAVIKRYTPEEFESVGYAEELKILKEYYLRKNNLLVKNTIYNVI